MDTYGLIGFPLKHSFSAKFFTQKFLAEKINAEYLNFEIENVHKVRQVILSNQNLKGLNVTIPYKEQIIPFLDEISTEAQKIGAVNVVNIERRPGDIYHYKLTGYNTDYIGFKQSIYPLIDLYSHKKALILGTGGASKAVAQALTDIGIEWKYVSRTPGIDHFSYNDLSKGIMSEYTVIVNASPVGTFPEIDRCPDIPYDNLSTRHLLYDLVYNPEESLFLHKGKEQGAITKNGKEMLELQALEAWKIWQKK